MGRNSRYKIEFRDSASKGHKRFGEALKRLFPLNKIYQEYPYDRIMRRGYSISRVPKDAWDSAMLSQASTLHADWVVLDLCLILEYNGEHHYQEIDYTRDANAAQAAYMRRQYLDKKKRKMANEAGFAILEIPYFEDDISDEGLVDKIREVLALRT